LIDQIASLRHALYSALRYIRPLPLLHSRLTLGGSGSVRRIVSIGIQVRSQPRARDRGQFLDATQMPQRYATPMANRSPADAEPPG